MSSSPQCGTELQPFILDSDDDSDSPPHITNDVHPCQGVTVDIPEGKNLYLEWPWKEQAELVMAWDIWVDSGILNLYATTCLRSTSRGDEPCRECQSLQNNRRLCHIQDTIHRAVPETAPYRYLGMSRL